MIQDAEKLAQSQDSLKQQKLDGSDYSNSLNDLSAKQFSQFLLTSPPTLKPHSSDFKKFVKDGVKPFYAVKDLISFFTKEGDFVLDVFSGYGENLRLLSDMSRFSAGIEKDLKKISFYKNSVIEDSFLDESTIFEGDALSVLSTLKTQYDFIIVDPPVKSQSFSSIPEDIKDASIDTYVSYISKVLLESFNVLKQDKYLVCLMQDFYYRGVYRPLPFRVSDIVCRESNNLVFKGIKIYSRQIDINTIKNRKVYAPVQNHFYALIFQKI